MVIKSLDDVLDDFNPSEHENTCNYKPITLWLPENYKLRYDQLQQKSSRRFCKKLREIILIAIDKTDLK